MSPKPVYMGDKHSALAMGMGKLKVEVSVGGRNQEMVIPNVLYVTDFCKSLYSVSKGEESGISFVFGNGQVKLLKEDIVVAEGEKFDDGLYKLKCSLVSNPQALTAQVAVTDLKLWHLRLGHLHYDGVKRTKTENLVKGLDFKDEKNPDLTLCKGCELGKAPKLKVLEGSESKTRKVLELIHSDVWGPSKIPSVGGKRYMLTFIDDFTKMVFVYFLRQQSEVFQTFKEFKAQVEKQQGVSIVNLRTDLSNGGDPRTVENISRMNLKIF
jgi:GAG-pre-integrase domain/Integrase core domain